MPDGRIPREVPADGEKKVTYRARYSWVTDPSPGR